MKKLEFQQLSSKKLTKKTNTSRLQMALQGRIIVVLKNRVSLESSGVILFNLIIAEKSETETIWKIVYLCVEKR